MKTQPEGFQSIHTVHWKRSPFANKHGRFFSALDKISPSVLAGNVLAQPKRQSSWEAEAIEDVEDLGEMVHDPGH